jgi:hypothetical protein
LVDLVRGDLLVEIQTGGFAPVRATLDALTRERRVCRQSFELEVPLPHEDELRVHASGRAFRRYGRTVAVRSLASVDDRVRIRDPAQVTALLPDELPDVFDTAELSEAAAVSRSLAAEGLLPALDGRPRAPRKA